MNWTHSYSNDLDQASVTTVEDDYALTPERVLNFRPTIPHSAEEASDVLLDKLEQAGRVPSKEKFRRMACNTFIFTGACPYNDRCVFLHDDRIKAEGVKVRTTRQSKSNSAIKDTFYWPDMSRREVVRHLDQQGLPTANQMYVIPEAFKTNPSNFHNRGLYSLWAHFVEFCVHNAVFYAKRYRDITSEPFFQVSAYRENPHVPGAKRLDVLVKLSLGKGLCPPHVTLSPALSAAIAPPTLTSPFSLGPQSFSSSSSSSSGLKFSSKEPVMSALLERQKRKTWSEANFKEHFPNYDVKYPFANTAGVAPYPSPVGYDHSSFSPSLKPEPTFQKNRSKSAGCSAEALFRSNWRSDYKPPASSMDYDLECMTEDLYDPSDYNNAQQVELSLRSIDFDDQNYSEAGDMINGPLSAATTHYGPPTFGWIDNPTSPQFPEKAMIGSSSSPMMELEDSSPEMNNCWENMGFEENNDEANYAPNQNQSINAPLRYGSFESPEPILKLASADLKPSSFGSAAKVLKPSKSQASTPKTSTEAYQSYTIQPPLERSFTGMTQASYTIQPPQSPPHSISNNKQSQNHSHYVIQPPVTGAKEIKQHYIIQPPLSATPLEEDHSYVIKPPTQQRWNGNDSNDWSSVSQYNDFFSHLSDNSSSSGSASTKRKKSKEPDYFTLKNHEFKAEDDWFTHLTCQD